MAETKGAYQVSVPKNLLNALNYYHRNYAAPIDDTMVWNTKEDLEAYIAISGSYAYAGQVVAVANGTIDASNGAKDYSLYVIRSDMSLQSVSGSKQYNSVAEANADIANIAEGTLLTIWNEEKGKTELYTVDNTSEGGKTLVRQSFDPADIPEMYWTALSHADGDTTTFTVQEIQDAVDTGKKVNEKLVMTDDVLSYNVPDNSEGAEEGAVIAKQLAFVSDIPNTFDASAIVSGTVSIDRLPKGALERVVVVENDEARMDLTENDIQLGDTVKVSGTGQMYFVKDASKLGTEDAFEVYTATAATSVAWAGVQNKPTTVSGYGITDALTDEDASATAVAGKLLYVGADGKLPASITGDAATVGGHAADYFATEASVTALSGTVDGIGTRVGTAEGKISALETKAQAHDTALETLNTTTIPNICNGTSITALAASKLTGTVARENLPSDVSGFGVAVADAAARKALTKGPVYNGWIVKQNDTGAVYVVIDDTNLDEDAGYLEIVAHGGDKIDWTDIANAPTTLAGYGITDAVNKNEKVTVASAENTGKILVLNDDGKLDADITGTAADSAKLGGKAIDYFATQEGLNGVVADMNTAKQDITNLKSGEAITALAANKLTGIVPVENLPHGALERLVVVTNDTERFALTADQVQVGDTVKVNETGLMYFVVDEDKLASEDGYEEYTAGTASAVDWSGVLNKPTTLRGAGAYGFTDIDDVVFEDELIASGIDASGHAVASNAGKVVKLNASGKLDVQITGKVDWSQLENAPTSTVEAIDAAVAAATHANRAQLDKIAEATGADSVVRATYGGKELAYVSDAKQAALDLIPLVDSEPTNAVEGQFCLVPITGAAS